MNVDTTAPKPDDSVAELKDSMKKSVEWVTPYNAYVILFLTAIDILMPVLPGGTNKMMAAVLAAIAILLAHRWYRTKAEKDKPENNGVPLLIVLLRNRFNMALLLSLVGGVLYLGWSEAFAEERESLLGNTVPPIAQLQDSLAKLIRNTDRIAAALDPADPVKKLDTMGYGMDEQSKARAVEAAHIDALRLYRDAGQQLPLATPVFGERGGSNLEQPIMAKNPKLGEVLDILAQQGTPLDARYPVTFTQLQTAQIPQFEGLTKIARRKYPKGTSVFLHNQVYANALVLAIWAENREAAGKLLALGANPEEGVDANLFFMAENGTGGQKVVKLLSAKEEAKRLGRSDMLSVRP